MIPVTFERSEFSFSAIRCIGSGSPSAPSTLACTVVSPCAAAADS